jgi:hypothetical protein
MIRMRPFHQMTPTRTTYLACRICRAEVVLDTDPIVRAAEVAAFCAAHNTHDQGLGVEIVIPLRRMPEDR